jgi:hypothetical protein
MPALALVFELLNWAAKIPKSLDSNSTEQYLTLKTKVNPPKNVSLESAKMAARWINYLTEHMHCLYQPSLAPAAKGANEILKKIRTKKLESGFSLRELVRNKWSHLSDQVIVEQAIGILEDCNYLREQPVKHLSLGRKPSPRFDINPDTFREVKYGL